MRLGRATLIALGVTLAAYVAIAWLVGWIAIPADVPTARVFWVQPFRVVSALGFAIAAFLPLPHVGGQLIAAVVLGSVLGAVFATARHLLS